jgi:hypothetical protein
MARFSGNGKAENPELVDEEVVRPLVDFAEKMIKEKEKTTSSIEKRLQQRIAQGQLGNSTRSQIQVRLQGFFRKPHPGDQVRYEAAKANEDLAILLTNIVKDHARIAVYSHYIATEAKKVMMQRDWELPLEVQEYGALLSGLNSEVLAQTVVEVMTMYPEIALANVKRAMNQQ